MEREVTVRDANQNFAKYVRAVESGETFVITKRGQPVARLVPVERGQRRLTPEQEAALARTIERMQKGWPLGGGRFDRDSLYDE